MEKYISFDEEFFEAAKPMLGCRFDNASFEEFKEMIPDSFDPRVLLKFHAQSNLTMVNIIIDEEGEGVCVDMYGFYPYNDSMVPSSGLYFSPYEINQNRKYNIVVENHCEKIEVNDNFNTIFVKDEDDNIITTLVAQMWNDVDQDFM